MANRLLLLAATWVFAPLASCQPASSLVPWARDVMNYGLIIDAGSGGSRMHIYQWSPRTFNEAPPPYTIPRGLAHAGVAKAKPGIAQVDISDGTGAMRAYLKPLVDFVRRELASEKARWGTFPLYLKATAGMRLLSNSALEAQLGAIRECLGDASFNPFRFAPQDARVISGEEEGTYGWSTVNWYLGTLLGKTGAGGTGTATPTLTYGALDLGGASTQITFFRPLQDVLANMFRVQIGDRRHWNLYTHSFLHYGRNTALAMCQQRLARIAAAEQHNWVDSGSIGGMGGIPARRRLLRRRRLVAAATGGSAAAGSGTVATATAGGGNPSDAIATANDPCLPGGEMALVSVVGRDKDGAAQMRTVRLVGDGRVTSYGACRAAVLPLLNREANAWCRFSHGGQCSFAGVYQPPLPSGSSYGHFVAFGAYPDIFRFAGAIWGETPSRGNATLGAVEAGLRELCALDMAGLAARAARIGAADGRGAFKERLSAYCFMGAYAVVLLRDGYGMYTGGAGEPLPAAGVAEAAIAEAAGGKSAAAAVRAAYPVQVLSALFDVDVPTLGRSMPIDWTAGAMLYETNVLPWAFVSPGSGLQWRTATILLAGVLLAALVGGAVLNDRQTRGWQRRLAALRRQLGAVEQDGERGGAPSANPVELLPARVGSAHAQLKQQGQPSRGGGDEQKDGLLQGSDAAGSGTTTYGSVEDANV